MGKNKKPALALVLVGAAVLIAFLPCLWNGFTNWDDQELVTGNPQLGSLSPANVLRIFVRPNVGAYIPLTILSFTVEYQFFRLNPFFYHLTNLLLHAANVLLVFWLVYLLFGDLRLAAAASLFFGLHPLRVESVAWVTERKDVLYAFFFLLAMASHLKFRRKKKPAWLAAGLAFFVLSVLAKPMGITLPAAVLLLDFLEDRRFSLSALKRAAPYLALAVPLGIVNVLAIRSMDHPPFDLVRNSLIAGYNYVFYIAKTALPLNLSGFYPYPNRDLQTIPFYFYVTALLAAAGVAALAVFGRKNRHLLFSGLFYIVTLAPVCQLIPLPGAAVAADRYSYLPILGVIYLLGLAGVRLWQRFAVNSKPARSLVLLGFGAVLAAMAVGSAVRCRDWKDSLTLWNDVLRKYPDNSLALNNRGRAYTILGQTERAIEDFDRSIQADPQYELPYYNRGVALDKLKKYELAIADFNRTISLNPKLAVAYEGRGAAYSHLGDQERALEDFDLALKLEPSMDVAYIDRGLAYFRLGQYDRALREYDRALDLDPFFAETYLHRGDVRFRLDELGLAIKDYTRALSLQPRYPDAYYNRAVAYKAMAEPDLALADYDRAIDIKPDFAEAYNNRGNLLLGRQEYEAALADYDRAVRFKPDYAEAYFNRAAARYTIEEYARAWPDLVRAESLGFPVDPEFKRLLSSRIRGR